MPEQLQLHLHGKDGGDHAALAAHPADSFAAFTSTHPDVTLDVTDTTPQDRPCPGCGQTRLVTASRRRQENGTPVVETRTACAACCFVVSFCITYPDRRRSNRIRPPTRQDRPTTEPRRHPDDAPPDG